jgi:hypothetical protein
VAFGINGAALAMANLLSGFARPSGAKHVEIIDDDRKVRGI